MNRYATDLMMQQSKDHTVALLYPKGYRWWQRKCYISSCSVEKGIMVYKLVNSLPIPLLYGIKQPGNFLNCDLSRKNLESFYEEFCPEVLHLHTLMGMPESVLHFFKEKGVKIVFSSHDYFGICPKVNLINEKGELCSGPSAERCARCNTSAPSTLYLRLRNSAVAFIIRDFIRWIKSMIHF